MHARRFLLALILGFAAAAGWLLAGLGHPVALVLAQEDGAEDEPPALIDLDKTDLLRLSGFDRLTLRDDTVYDIEPVDPRPLPEMRRNDELQIRLLQGDESDVKVEWRHVAELKYFEDMVLEKADRLAEQGRFDVAFEHILAVDRARPDWPTLSEHKQRFYAAEAGASIGQSDYQAALHLVTELYALNAEHPQLEPLVARIADAMAADYFASKSFRQGRRVIERLERIDPGSETLVRWRERYQQRSEQLINQAVEEETNGNLRAATLLVQEAAFAWPDTPGLDEAFRRITGKYPRLVVAVGSLPEGFDAWPATPADRRAARLIQVPLFELHGLAEGGSYRSRFVERVEEMQAASGMILHLRDEAVDEAGSPLTAQDVAQAILKRSRLGGVQGDTRLQDVIQSVGTEGLFKVRVEFARAPVSREAWLSWYVPTAAVRLDDSTSPDEARGGAGPFRVEEIGRNEVLYEARRPAREGGPKLREIVERRMGPVAAAKALVNGDVGLIERVSRWHARKLMNREGIRVARFAAPEVHVLAFNFDRPELRNRTLRRAIVYAIDRRRLLEEELLGGPVDAANTIPSGPFPKGSYAADPRLEAREYNPAVARVLMGAAKKELEGELPTLRLLCPSDDDLRVVCERIRENLLQAGLEIELVQGNVENWTSRAELLYRTYQVTDPIRGAAEFLTGQPRATAVDFPIRMSSWISELLLQLERAPDWPAATAILRQIHSAAYHEVIVVPLWQMEVSFAYNEQLTGLPESPVSLYQGVEDWQVQPWRPK